MEDDKRRLYELHMLVDAQKKKIMKLGSQIRVAHRQSVKSIPTNTLLWILLKRLVTQIRRRIHL